MITLKTLEKDSAQEVFDHISEHLLTQNKKCTDNKICVYSNFKGLKCAAGCLISDDEYNPKFEGNSWGALVQNNAVPSTHVSLIRQLQYMHDEYDPEEWIDFLCDIASQNNLSPQILNKFQ